MNLDLVEDCLRTTFSPSIRCLTTSDSLSAFFISSMSTVHGLCFFDSSIHLESGLDVDLACVLVDWATCIRWLTNYVLVDWATGGVGWETCAAEVEKLGILSGNGPWITVPETNTLLNDLSCSDNLGTCSESQDLYDERFAKSINPSCFTPEYFGMGPQATAPVTWPASVAFSSGNSHRNSHRLCGMNKKPNLAKLFCHVPIRSPLT